MNTAKRIISFSLIGMLSLGLAGCGKSDNDSKEALSTETAINVTVDKVKKGSIDENISYTGEIKSANSASVSSKVSGSIKSINADVGDYVSAGSVLLTVDSSQYNLAYNQASAAYASACAALEAARASYNNVSGGSLEQSKVNMHQSISSAQTAYNTALDNYNRQKTLFEIGAISKVALDSAKTSLDNAKLALDTATANAELNESVVIPQTKAGADASLNQAQAGVSQAKAALDIAKSNLNNCTITAPISGYVTSTNAKIGQMASPGVELFAIKDMNELEVELNVTESVISNVTTSTKTKIDVKAADLKNLDGVVSKVSNAKDERTGMYLVKIAIPNSENKIKVGMLADVTLVTNGAKNTITADANAVIYKNEVHYVYVADGSKAIKRVVTIGVTDGKRTQILKGLKEGESVIVDGKDFLSEKNNKIRIVK